MLYKFCKTTIFLFQINRICADRGVFFTYVDLRWGITSEQTSYGKTIAICLQEVGQMFCVCSIIITQDKAQKVLIFFLFSYKNICCGY